MGENFTHTCVEGEERKRMEVERGQTVAGRGRNRRRKMSRGERNSVGREGVGACAPREMGERGDATWRPLVGRGLASGAHTGLACELQVREGVCIKICDTVII